MLMTGSERFAGHKYLQGSIHRRNFAVLSSKDVDRTSSVNQRNVRYVTLKDAHVRLQPRSLQPVDIGSPAVPKKSAAPGRVLGAIALITGSTVGAGMLALPAATVSAGFGPSAMTLGVCWLMLLLEALLMAEINMAVWEQQQAAATANGSGSRPAAAAGASPPTAACDAVVTLRQTAEATLGWQGSVCVTLTYLGLAYGLLIAYLSKCGEMLHLLFGGAVPVEAGSLLTAVAVGVLLRYGGCGGADLLNRWLTGGLLLAFLGLLLCTAPDPHHLPALLDGGQWGPATSALPIIFLTLVYHDLVPVLCAYLGRDAASIRTALLLGSLLPLALFITWEALCLGQAVEAGVDPVAALMAAGGPLASSAVQTFSLLAVCTSLIGAALGASETMRTELPLLGEVLRGSPLLGQSVRRASAAWQSCCQLPSTFFSKAAPVETDGGPRRSSGRKGEGSGAGGVVYCLTLGPPTAFALTHPGVFQHVLEVVGAYGMTLMYGVLPPLMAWQLRSKAQSPGSSSAHAGSGLLVSPPVLAGLLGFAVSVGCTQLAGDTHLTLAAVIAQLGAMEPLLP